MVGVIDEDAVPVDAERIALGAVVKGRPSPPWSIPGEQTGSGSNGSGSSGGFSRQWRNGCPTGQRRSLDNRKGFHCFSGIHSCHFSSTGHGVSSSTSSLAESASTSSVSGSPRELRFGQNRSTRKAEKRCVDFHLYTVNALLSVCHPQFDCLSQSSNVRTLYL